MGSTMAENAWPTHGAPGTIATFRLGDVLGKSFRLFGRHFGVFIALAAMVLGPLYLVFSAVVMFRPKGDLQIVLSIFLVVLTLAACPTIATGGMTSCIVQANRGQPVRVLATIKVLVRRFLPMMAVAIVLTPLVFLSILLPFLMTNAIAIFIPWVSVQADRRFADALVMLFLIFCYCLSFAATPVCTAEQNSIGVSLSRIRFLTEGHRWQIFGIVTLTAFLGLIVDIMANMAVRGIGAHADRIRVDIGRLIASYMVQVIFLAFIAVVAAVFYHQLRIAKDDVPIPSVFD